jgi:hypothetical protein
LSGRNALRTPAEFPSTFIDLTGSGAPDNLNALDNLDEVAMLELGHPNGIQNTFSFNVDTVVYQMLMVGLDLPVVIGFFKGVRHEFH